MTFTRHAPWNQTCAKKTHASSDSNVSAGFTRTSKAGVHTATTLSRIYGHRPSALMRLLKTECACASATAVAHLQSLHAHIPEQVLSTHLNLHKKCRSSASPSATTAIKRSDSRSDKVHGRHQVNSRKDRCHTRHRRRNDWSHYSVAMSIHSCSKATKWH